MAKAKWAPTGPFTDHPGPYSWQPWIFDPMVQICAHHLYKNNTPNPRPLPLLPSHPCAALIASPPLRPPSSRRSPLPAPHSLPHPAVVPSPRRCSPGKWWPASAERPALASGAGLDPAFPSLRPVHGGRIRHVAAGSGVWRTAPWPCLPRAPPPPPPPYSQGAVDVNPDHSGLLPTGGGSGVAAPPCNRRMAAGTVTSSPPRPTFPRRDGCRRLRPPQWQRRSSFTRRVPPLHGGSGVGGLRQWRQ
jgi:hypothetical protein